MSHFNSSNPCPLGVSLTARAAEIIAASPLLNLAYFTRLCSGAMSREAFVRSQRKFFFAVRYFSRPMAALVARMPDSSSRMDLVHNLAEEQGDFQPQLAHDRTFLDFLTSLGESPQSVLAGSPGAGVDAFNFTLMGVCMGGSRDAAMACLGIIEYAFADIAACIGQAVIDRHWIARENLVHYGLHAEIDKRHAAEFFGNIEPAWLAGDSSRQVIEDGLQLGRHIFARLYDDLYTDSDFS